jgi:hypothetical protein
MLDRDLTLRGLVTAEQRLVAVEKALKTKQWMHFPSYESTKYLSDKLILAQNLDHDAASRGWTCPRTVVLQEGEDVSPHAVVKCRRGEGGMLVWLKGFKWSKIAHKANRPPPNAGFLAQEFVPTLKNQGEFRCFFVNGIHLYTVHTVHTTGHATDLYDANVVEEWHSLAKIS